MVTSLIKLTPPPCNGFGAPVFQTLGGGDKNGVGGKGLGTRLGPCNGFGAPVFQTLGGGDKNGVGGKGLGTRLRTHHNLKTKRYFKILADLNPRECGFRYIEAFSLTRIQSIELEFNPSSCHPCNRYTHTP